MVIYLEHSRALVVAMNLFILRTLAWFAHQSAIRTSVRIFNHSNLDLSLHLQPRLVTLSYLDLFGKQPCKCCIELAYPDLALSTFRVSCAAAAAILVGKLGRRSEAAAVLSNSRAHTFRGCKTQGATFFLLEMRVAL